jgi:hypothetical protein
MYLLRAYGFANRFKRRYPNTISINGHVTGISEDREELPRPAVRPPAQSDK